MALLTRDDGYVQQPQDDPSQLQIAGYYKCPTRKFRKIADGSYTPCPFWLSPEAVEATKDNSGGYFTCPVCKRSYDLLHELPWHGVDPEEAQYNADQDREQWHAGGGTRIGLLMSDQAQIGENLVEQIGELPGYGAITWWHQGGATASSPLDGATKDWGIEVKTLGYDATHHRFVPGRVQEKTDKNNMAQQMGKQGVLGVLVLLDYRRSVADIYVKEMPLGGRVDPNDPSGKVRTGVGTFRSSAGMHLIKEIPFKNPLMDPKDPQPVATGDKPTNLGGEYSEGTPF